MAISIASALNNTSGRPGPSGPILGLQASYRAARGAHGHRGAVVQRTVLVEAGSVQQCPGKTADSTCCGEAGWDDMRTVGAERHGATAGCRLGYSGRRRASRPQTMWDVETKQNGLQSCQHAR
jgi:hypothetical protein